MFFSLNKGNIREFLELLCFTWISTFLSSQLSMHFAGSRNLRHTT